MRPVMRTTYQPSAVRDRGPWYRISNKKDGDTAEVMLYDEIGGWFGVTADDFVRDLGKIDAKNITVRINSPGGSVFDGVSIMNALRLHPAHITTRVEGTACSAASFIAMSGDTVQMCRSTSLMVHNAMGFSFGYASDMRKTADLLDKISGQIAGEYAARTGASVEEWLAAMDKETWYTEREALEGGLIDEIVGADDDGPVEPMPANAFDLSIFNYAGRENAPDPWIPGRSGTPRNPADRAGNAATAPVVADVQAIAAALRGALKR